MQGVQFNIPKLESLGQFTGEPAFTAAGGTDHTDAVIWEVDQGVHCVRCRVAYYNLLGCV